MCRPVILLAFFGMLFSPLSGLAQTTERTITVTGSSLFNLSPDEIIIQLGFQEYFTDPEETPAKKVTLESIEKQVLKALDEAKVDPAKITVGAASVVQPYINGTYRKRRLNKSLFVCLSTTQEYVDLTRSLEAHNLLDQIITDFSIVEYRHTKKEEYLTQSRHLAYQDALEKTKLILGQSGAKLGEVLQIVELDTNRYGPAPGSSYEVETTAETPSGFKAIVIAYELRVTFAIQ